VVVEMKRDDIPEDHNGKLVTTGYSLEFVWSGTTFDRMLKGLQKFEDDHKSISLPIYETIIGLRNPDKLTSKKDKEALFKHMGTRHREHDVHRNKNNDDVIIKHPKMPKLNEF
jgi:regulator of nonsense transcripts 1